MEVPLSSYPLTFLQFFGIQLVILFTAAILFAAVSMAFSQFTRNGIAVMGLMIGFYLATQFISVPKSFRIASQSMAMLPTELINLWSLLESGDNSHLGMIRWTDFLSYFSHIIIAAMIILVKQKKDEAKDLYDT